MPGTQYPRDTVQLYTQHLFCPVLLLHIPPDGLHPPPTAATLTSVYHANTLLAGVDPSEFTPLFVVCLSAPVLHANYVAQFLFLFSTDHRLGRPFL